MEHRLRFGPYTVDVSHPDKVLFPADGVTKLELCEHYGRSAERMLPLLRERPLSLQRFPDGIEEEGFYQKNASDWFPEWIRTERVDKKEGGTNRQVVADNAATLVYLAGQATITLHAFTSTTEHPQRPDRIVFDLDPPGDDFDEVIAAARRTREALDEIGLASFVMTTGSDGLHVVSPIRPEMDFDDAYRLAGDLAARIAARAPDRLTVEFRKKKRAGRLFLDTRRNLYAQTSVAPYSVRARSGAPVATPLEWDELDDDSVGPRTWTIRNLEDRLARDDPWKGIGRHARDPFTARERLDRLPAVGGDA